MSPPRIPYHGPVVTGAQDRDNFVRNLITVLYPYAAGAWRGGSAGLRAYALDVDRRASAGR